MDNSNQSTPLYSTPPNQPVKNSPAIKKLQSRPPLQITPIQIIIAIFVFIVSIILVISLISIFRKNPYGPETKIDNFSQYYRQTPSDVRDLTFSQLYGIIDNNLSDDTKVPTSGAKIRKDTNTNKYDASSDINYYTFMVDIESIQQSYYVQISWSKNSNNNALGGYPILITCPKPDQLIYKEFSCQDSQTNLGNSSDPAFSVLPVTVAYYTSNNSFVKYQISCQTYSNEADATIYIDINDETGGNHEAALAKIRDLGLNPDNYIVRYNDNSENQYLAPAPSD